MKLTHIKDYPGFSSLRKLIGSFFMVFVSATMKGWALVGAPPPIPCQYVASPTLAGKSSYLGMWASGEEEYPQISVINYPDNKI